jgi:hypothetical protein
MEKRKELSLLYVKDSSSEIDGFQQALGEETWENIDSNFCLKLQL